MNNHHNHSLRFDKGVMRLSAFDPISNQYETRVLTLPELPLLESLESMCDSNGSVLRMTKSCSSKKTVNPVTMTRSDQSSHGHHPRRCQSHPNLSKRQKKQQQQQQQHQQQHHHQQNQQQQQHHQQNQQQQQQQQQQQHQDQQKQQQELQQPHNKYAVFTSSTIRSKRGLSSAFNAVAGLFQKGSSATNHNEKMMRIQQQRQELTCDNWWMSSPPISSC